MKRILPTALLLLLAATLPAAGQSDDMSFFITSHGPGNGANLGGLEGADAWCEHLAYAVGHGDKEWRAYLSTTGPNGQNARDRIGEGPWYNADGVMVARDLDHLHSEDANIDQETTLTERGAQILGRGMAVNTHDILTGSDLQGNAMDSGVDTTCDNWTSQYSAGSAQVGHYDRTGGGANPTSWNSAHGSRGCSQANLRATGGDGYFYCFAPGSDGMRQEQPAFLLRD